MYVLMSQIHTNVHCHFTSRLCSQYSRFNKIVVLSQIPDSDWTRKSLLHGGQFLLIFVTSALRYPVNHNNQLYQKLQVSTKTQPLYF